MYRSQYNGCESGTGGPDLSRGGGEGDGYNYCYQSGKQWSSGESRPLVGATPTLTSVNGWDIPHNPIPLHTPGSSLGTTFVPNPNDAREIYAWVQSLKNGTRVPGTAEHGSDSRRDYRRDKKRSYHTPSPPGSSSRAGTSIRSRDKEDRGAHLLNNFNSSLSKPVDGGMSLGRGPSSNLSPVESSKRRKISRGSHESSGGNYRQKLRSPSYRRRECSSRIRISRNDQSKSRSRSKTRSRDHDRHRSHHKRNSEPEIRNEDRSRAMRDGPANYRKSSKERRSRDLESVVKSEDRSRRNGSVKDRNPSKDRKSRASEPLTRNEDRSLPMRTRASKYGNYSKEKGSGKCSSGYTTGVGVTNDLPRRRSASAVGSSRVSKTPPLSKGQMEYALAFLKDDDKEEGDQVQAWIRSAPDDLYYGRKSNGEMDGTSRTEQLCQKFQATLVDKPRALRVEAEDIGKAKMVELIQKEREGREREELESGETDSSSSDSSSDDEVPSRTDKANDELQRRKKHPRRLHAELWHNDPGLMNDGPVCRCSAKARRNGIRHGFYAGETRIPRCNPYSNNSSRLHHYRVTVSPLNNFIVNKPTVIQHDSHTYNFEGFSVFSHQPIDLRVLPPCSVIRFNIRYDVSIEEEKILESFCVKELQLFEDYLFREVLELVDMKLGVEFDDDTTCPNFHIFPRFVRSLPDNGKEVLSMSRVLLHLLKSDKEVMKEEDLSQLYTVEQTEWQNVADKHKGTIVTKWGMKPAAIRVDQIDRDVGDHEQLADEGLPFPLIVHFGIRPPQLSYAGNAGYQRAWRQYVKYRHLLSNMPKPSAEDKRKLVAKEMKLQEMRTASTMKRDVTVAVSCKGFRRTGLCCDIVQHAMLIPVLVGHLRFHNSLAHLERRMLYRFTTPYLLQLALTHPSYRENFGTNPDHARNTLTNCGIRQPEYGDRKIHYASTRKRGINTLINIMAKFGETHETQSEITHNERLEFLGDAVVEFVTSIHLFHLFPNLEEGGLATYRAAIVQNQHLARLAQTLELDQFMLYAHGSDLCHDSELRHAMANCLEALMGAIFLDGGIMEADRVFGNTLFNDDGPLGNVWRDYPRHPLQSEHPKGDRHLIGLMEALQKLNTFENSVGIQFNHIRLLARAFTDRSLGYNLMSKGSNQRLEFLGDTVLQLISSEYLYRFFPDHHEGHLSLLRSSLVNNRTQSLVCDDLNLPEYALRADPKAEMKTKDRADLLEAFLGALYVDQGLIPCIVFCQVCFIPRLTNSIVKQEWNDPKSKLQQCCLTLRAMNGKEPDIPVYKVIESLGPTNTRIYIVAVYFRGKRLACGGGHSIQDAEMRAAATALEKCVDLFPQLNHQKRVMDKTSKKEKR